jgi:hypothetical protein
MSPPSPDADRTLWLTVRGASPVVPLLWLAVTAAAFAAPALAAAFGPVGAVVPFLALGWALARRLPVPAEGHRRYHLDDVEVTAIGPRRAVRRVRWSAVESVTQERGSLTLAGAGTTLALPLAAIVRAGVWPAVLARIVPGLAEEMWTLLDEGEEVRLGAPVDPPLRALAWWAYAPAAIATAGTGDPAVLALAAGLAVAERAVALARARARRVRVHRAGLALRRRLWGFFVPWPRADVVRGAGGLLVTDADGGSAAISAGVRNFWAAAPVIELRAHLGPSPAATVTFRVRVAEGRLAVIGEVEPMA